MAGYVVAEEAVPTRMAEGDTASVQVAIDASVGCEQLEQRIVRFARGRSSERGLDDRQEVLYVAAGRGTVHLHGEAYELEPDMGVYVPAGDRYVIDNPGPDELLLVSVTAPREDAEGANGTSRPTVRYADRPVLPAGKDREFRYLVNREIGCKDVTQFVGTIPPGRAPMHSHVYDEVLYVIEGEGILHIGGESTPIAQGSCMHLPPLEPHCLENTASGPMRVLGVFHPAGDPASRAYEANK